jgi:hypothetical protein
MIILRFADTYIEAVEAEKNILGATIIQDMKKIDLSENAKWHDVLTKIVQGKAVSFLFPDAKTYIHRFSIPADTSEDVFHSMVLSKAKEIIPEKSTDLIYDYVKIQPDNVLFTAVAFAYVKPLIHSVQKSKSRIEFGTADSLALFYVFRSLIKPKETVGYLDIGQKQSTLMFFDDLGPLFSFTEPLETAQLKEAVHESLSYFEETYMQNVSRIIIGGEKSLDIDYTTFSDIFGDRKLIHMDKVLDETYKKNHVEFKSGLSSRVFPPSFFGTALLYFEKEKINLLTKENLEYIRSHQLQAQGKKPETVHSFLERSQVPTIDLDDAFPEEKIKKKRNARIVIMLLILAILIVSLIGLIYYRQQQNEQRENLRPTPSVPVNANTRNTTTPTNTPAPTPDIERSDITVRILNGTGAAGVASTAQELLESKGYEDIETGNADAFDYTETVIQLKPEIEVYRSLLEEDLRDSYDVSGEKAILDDEEEVDAVVIIGAEPTTVPEEDTPIDETPEEEQTSEEGEENAQ